MLESSNRLNSYLVIRGQTESSFFTIADVDNYELRPQRSQLACAEVYWCRRRDLNPHAPKGTSPSSWRVCLFRHSDAASTLAAEERTRFRYEPVVIGTFDHVGI